MPCLWFDDRIGEAVNFYVALFGGEILDRSNYGDAVPGKKGKLLTITFTLQDEKFLALNGGPQFKFTEALSFMVSCKDQAEVDKYWSALTADGGEGVDVRLVQGPLGPFVADHPGGAAAPDRSQGRRQGEARHAGDDADAQARHRGAGTSGGGLRERNHGEGNRHKSS